MDKDRKPGRPDRSGDEEAERIRVTDRRRIHLDGNGKEPSQVTEPSLKPSYVEELEARAKAAEQKLFEVQTRFDQLRAQLQRETDETRQRLNRAADERTQRDRAAFITALLPVMDNLQRAIEAAEGGSSLEAIVDGVKGTANSFEAALTAAGVEPIASVGEPFNPEMHEAVDTTAVEPEREGQVTAEYARGYRIGDRLLRPARVQVGRAKADARGATE